MASAVLVVITAPVRVMGFCPGNKWAATTLEIALADFSAKAASPIFPCAVCARRALRRGESFAALDRLSHLDDRTGTISSECECKPLNP